MSIEIFGPKDQAVLRRAGQAAAETLAYVGARLAPGVTTADIDAWVREDTARRGGVPSQLNYQGFPAAVCTSRNHVVCHGIPRRDERLAEGDIVNVDVTTQLDGFHGDTSATFFVGEPSAEARRIVEVARACRDAGIGAVRDGARLGDVGAAVEELARREGCSVVRELGGHGIGRVMHAPPHVAHHGRRGTGTRLRAGMVITIEPMLNLGGAAVRFLDDGWTVVTADGSLSAQFEHTVLVTRDGCEVLTVLPPAMTGYREEADAPALVERALASPQPGGSVTPVAGRGKRRSWYAPALMADLADGETTQIKGSGASPYILRNTGGVYSCSCPAWRNQSIAIERRTCKHLKKLRGEAEELARVGAPAPSPPQNKVATGSEEEEEGKGPPLLLAHAWAGDVDLAGWWMSEKLDGVRAYWDGKQFLSRLGNPYYAPTWFVDGLPEVPLDGELWGGRKKFQRTVSIARRQDRSDHWKELRYVVFDAPAMDAPFEARLRFCEEHLRVRLLPYVQHHEHVVCGGTDHLKAELARVEALGGEGLMLRQPGSKYEVGRSTTLLKVKTFHDAEARVVAHAAGEGRHKGRVGALVVEMANGTRFSVGTGLSDEDRRHPPAVGSLITYRYQELSEGGVPRFPSYVGPAIDKKL